MTDATKDLIERLTDWLKSDQALARGLGDERGEATVTALLAELERLSAPVATSEPVAVKALETCEYTGRPQSHCQKHELCCSYPDCLTTPPAPALDVAIEATECEGQLCYYHGCQNLPGCTLKATRETV